jgi:membrane-associated phospholipid phosphatase
MVKPNYKVGKLNIQQFLRSVCIAAICLGSWSAQANEFNDVDWVKDLESPVTTDAKWILLSGAGLTLATAAMHHSTFDSFENTTVANKPLGTSSKYGDWLGQMLPNGVYVGVQYLAWYGGEPLAEYRGFMMLEATAYAAGVTTLLKYAIREPRPNSTARDSFPSGHSTTAFAFAGIVAAEHGWYYGVPAMAMATFVGYSRINDDQHRVHDVVAGATIGLSCSYGIYYAHKPQREKAQSKVMLMPTVIPGGAEMLASWRF